jgi:hypothetical protein
VIGSFIIYIFFKKTDGFPEGVHGLRSELQHVDGRDRTGTEEKGSRRLFPGTKFF